MTKPTILALAIVCLTSINAYAQMRVSGGDFYIRSQSQTGNFSGHHQLLTEAKPGYLPAVYCDRAFWVRKSTVLWTENEANAGRKLVIEVNKLNSREVVCKDPDRHVKLETLGLEKREIDQLRGQGGEAYTTRGRLGHISKAFTNK
ncbi:hypothetical protein [Roseibium sp.]|uniref:hypothetical protein n=1 Tax=Roseibium sp. TaxID=1936156 RepID=UPI003A968BCD